MASPHFGAFVCVEGACQRASILFTNYLSYPRVSRELVLGSPTPQGLVWVALTSQLPAQSHSLRVSSPDLPCLRFPRRPPSQLHLGCIAPLLAPAPPPRRGRDGFCCPLLSGGPATLAPAPQVSGLHGEHTERTPRFLLSGPKCGRRSAAWGIGDSKLGPRGGRWQEVCRQVNVWTQRHIGGSWGQGLPSGFSARG